MPGRCQELSFFTEARVKSTAQSSRTGDEVLTITALGNDVADARKRAYAAIERIKWPEGFFRRDIGWRATARDSKK